MDVNGDRIAAWNSSQLPNPRSPGFREVVARARGRNLFFSTDVERGIEEADIIFVSVNTPTKAFGHGAGMASDLQYWERDRPANPPCQQGIKDHCREEHFTRAYGGGNGADPEQ